MPVHTQRDRGERAEVPAVERKRRVEDLAHRERAKHGRRHGAEKILQSLHARPTSTIASRTTASTWRSRPPSTWCSTSRSPASARARSRRCSTWLILVGASLAVLLVLGILVGLRRAAGPAWRPCCSLLGGFLVWNGYFILFEGLRRGQTPGKRIAGIRVVMDTGPRGDHRRRRRAQPAPRRRLPAAALPHRPAAGGVPPPRQAAGRSGRRHGREPGPAPGGARRPQRARPTPASRPRSPSSTTRRSGCSPRFAARQAELAPDGADPAGRRPRRPAGRATPRRPARATWRTCSRCTRPERGRAGRADSPRGARRARAPGSSAQKRAPLGRVRAAGRARGRARGSTASRPTSCRTSPPATARWPPTWPGRAPTARIRRRSRDWSGWRPPATTRSTATSGAPGAGSGSCWRASVRRP